MAMLEGQYVYNLVSDLQRQIFILENNIQNKDRVIRDQDITIRDQNLRLINPIKIHQKTQTTASQKNSTVITVKNTRKDSEELDERSRAQREQETRDRFIELANLLEGGQQDGGGDIARVSVTVHYRDGRTLDFWAKGDRNNVDNLGNNQEVENRDREIADVVVPGGDEEQVELEAEAEEERKKKFLRAIVRVKVKHLISNTTLQELRLAGLSDIPPINTISEEFDRLSTCVDITTIHGKNAGIRKLQDLLELALQQRKYQDCVTNDNEVLLRFAADGARIAKSRDSVRAVFKILTPREDLSAEPLATSPDDELTLLFYMGKEDRETFQELARQTLSEMMRAAEQGLMINDTLVKVKWVFCSDWKAMAIMRGINPPNSNHFCLWCECSKSQILDFSVPDWPVTRSAKRQKQCLTLKGQANRRGYSTTDLVSWIAFEDMVPDELHLRMRITNKLLNQVTKWSIDAKLTRELLAEMKRIGVDFRLSEELGDDGVGKITKWTQPNGDALQKILGKLKVSNVLGQGRLLMTPQLGKLSIDDLKRELETRHLLTTGNKATLVKRLTAALLPGEKVILRQSRSRKRPAVSYDFSDEDFSGSEPDDDPVARAGSSTGHRRKDFVDIDKLEALWEQFAVLMSALKACPGTEGYMSGDEFGNHARRWATEFRKITFDEDVIPYIHCLVYHVPQALRKFRYLPDIGISQVERKNYDQHLAYFGATSREGGRHKMNVSKQILRRENVLLYYALNDEDIPKAKRRKVEKL